MELLIMTYWDTAEIAMKCIIVFGLLSVHELHICALP